jgi:hypothetical protein
VRPAWATQQDPVSETKQNKKSDLIQIKNFVSAEYIIKKTNR